jgi:hypothetical protein
VSFTVVYWIVTGFWEAALKTTFTVSVPAAALAVPVWNPTVGCAVAGTAQLPPQEKHAGQDENTSPVAGEQIPFAYRHGVSSNGFGRKKKPTWRNTLRYSTTSAYHSTSLPAMLDCPSSSRPTTLKTRLFRPSERSPDPTPSSYRHGGKLQGDFSDAPNIKYPFSMESHSGRV